MEREPKEKQEHTLVCLSSSPTNARIVRTAAKMASAFGGSFTALYVQTSGSEKMNPQDRKRLQNHIRLAQQLGATVTTVYGEDVSYQIAEFARISGVTKIVIGRSNARRRYFWSNPTLTEKLTEITPNLDIYIIPDSTAHRRYRPRISPFLHDLIPYPRDIVISLVILALTTLVGLMFYGLGFTEANIITVYILAVLLTSLFTRGYVCGLIGAVISVVLFNYFFTEPRLTFHAYDSGYSVTFVIMFLAAMITGTLAAKLKTQARLSAQAAFRTKVLLDTNQLLQKARDDDDIINITATQLMKLLDRSVVMYAAGEGGLSKGSLFPADSDETRKDLFSAAEQEVVRWVYENSHRAGATTEVFPHAECLYMAIRINSSVYGVVGIHIAGKPLDSFEQSVILSILGECALAIENARNAREKEQAAVLAKNEQLRANLLRTISHDLRTPLTSISGNAGNLLANAQKLDEEARIQAYSDIFDDSQWLMGLVENLLSVTRIEEGRINFQKSLQLMDEVIEEAMKHISRKRDEHEITVRCQDTLLPVRVDAKLIIQVIINLVDNAIKYTPRGSHIEVYARKTGDTVSVSVTDDGPGIPDAAKPRVFEMFYTGEMKIADSRRSLGLGLALCKSIVGAHGGEITLTDHVPSGCCFTFTLPVGEVNTNEETADSCG